MNSKNIKLYRVFHVLKMKKMQKYSNYGVKYVPTVKLYGWVWKTSVSVSVLHLFPQTQLLFVYSIH